MLESEEENVVFYDEIKVRGRNSFLFVVDKKEYWFPVDHIEVDEENKKVHLAKWLYDKYFI